MTTVICLVLIGIIAYYIYTKIEDAKTFVHLKTGNVYYILYTGKLKDSTGVWKECIIYQATYDHKIYARESEDFYNKFMNKKLYEREERK